MARRKKLIREFTDIFKDKASIIKASLTTKRTLSSVKIAVLRATSHSSTSPPPEHRLETILKLGHDIPIIASACIDAVMDRLHNTQNPNVALKCLLILHNIITHGSFILKKQLSYYPFNGGQNSLKLTRFANKRNVENWELSQWVRWYASVLERNLISSRTLGCYISCSSSFSKSHEFRQKGKSNCSLDCDLLKEIDSLVCMVEGICAAPESLHYQKMDLVHELMLLVSEDYRGTQHQIITRLGKFDGKIDKLRSDESSELLCYLKRVEDCRERLVEMFANRKRNDAFWDLISQTKRELEDLNEKRARGRMVLWKSEQEMAAAITRIGDQRVKGTSHELRLLPCSSQQWLGMERVQFTVSTAFA